MIDREHLDIISSLLTHASDMLDRLKNHLSIDGHIDKDNIRTDLVQIERRDGDS